MDKWFLLSCPIQKIHKEVLKTQGVGKILRSKKKQTPVPDEQVDESRLLGSQVVLFLNGLESKVGDSVGFEKTVILI